MLTFGIGLGLCMQTVTLVMQNAVPAADIGVATSSATFFRQVGGTLGTAVFLSILFSNVGTKVRSAYQNAFAGKDPDFSKATAHPASLSTADQNFISALKSGTGGAIDLNDTSFLSKLSSAVAHPFQVGFSQAMDTVFLFGAGTIAIGFIVSLMLKEVPLRTQSGHQAAEAEAAVAAVPGPH
jgi:hypothetical protein